MKNLFIFSLLFIVFLACEKDLSPLVNDEFIYFTGQTNNGLYEFRITNISDDTLLYWGYDENFPIYQYSILKNNEWEEIGPGWCGTGLNQYVLNSGDSFLINIVPPDNENPWRAAIRMYSSPTDKGDLKWSQRIK